MICRWCGRHFDIPEPGDPRITERFLPSMITLERESIAVSDSIGHYIREVRVTLCSWGCVAAYAAYQVVTLESTIDDPRTRGEADAVETRDAYLATMRQVDHRQAAIRQSIDGAGIDIDRLGQPEERVDQEMRIVGYWIPLVDGTGYVDHVRQQERGEVAVASTFGPNIPRLTAEYQQLRRDAEERERTARADSQRVRDEAAHGREADPILRVTSREPHIPVKDASIGGFIGSTIPPKSEGL